ncbi:MAG: hypothetical protein ABIZ49_13100 [Opitutaceae bacterium]
MGAFYHSLHVRSSDQVGVQRVLEEIIRERAQRLWMSPAVNGWVSIFPDDLAVVLTLGPLLSRHCRADALATVVHDSDVFLYTVFRDGEKIEEYESAPDYFEPKNPPTPRVTPRHVLTFLPTAKDASALVTLLTGEPSDFADDQFAGFLRLLGIEYGQSTYDDLAGKDADDVPRRREFVHVPDLAAEKVAKKATQEKLRDAQRALIRTGVLVFDSELVRKPRAYRFPFDILRSAEGRAGFVALNFNEQPGLFPLGSAD